MDAPQHLVYLLIKPKEGKIVSVAHNFEKKHILFKNMQMVFYSTQFIVIIGLNKLTQIMELIVQSETWRISPSVRDEFKSFNFKPEKRYLYELVGKKVPQEFL